MNHDPNDENFLSGALSRAADAMPGGEADELHISFPVVRDRVRRRRAAKIGGVTGTSLALAGVLVLGATQLPLADRDEQVPPAAPSALLEPDDTTSPSPTADPEGPPASGVIQDGYTPPWLEWSDLTCGMPDADLRTTAEGWSASSSGDLYSRTTDMGGDLSTTRGMAATVQQGTGAAGSFDVPPVLVWSQDGVVVDLGTEVFEGPFQTEPLLGAGEGVVEAQSGMFTTCAPVDGDAGTLYETPLPDGDYDVRVVGFPQLGSGEFATVVSEPVQVRIDADGAHAAGTAVGESALELPEPAAGQITRFELDRTTQWRTAVQTQSGYSSDAEMRIVGRCDGPDPEAVLPVEVVLGSTGEALVTDQIGCDGQEQTIEVGVLPGGGEALDLRLPQVPDGVARAWISLEP